MHQTKSKLSVAYPSLSHLLLLLKCPLSCHSNLPLIVSYISRGACHPVLLLKYLQAIAMFPTTIRGVALTVLTALQVQALKITFPTNKVHQTDVNTPLMFSWTSNTSDPEFMDIVIKYKKELKLGDFTQGATGMLVPGQSIPSKSNVFLIPWNIWPYQVGMFCQIIIGNSTTQETFDHTNVFQLVNINPTSAYGRPSSTLPATTPSATIASSSITSLQYPGYGGYSVSLPAFSELDSNMTEWACTQTSWEFSGQSPDIRSYLETATDCEQYSTMTGDEYVTGTSTKGLPTTSSVNTSVATSGSTRAVSTSPSTTASPPATPASSMTALPTQTSASSPTKRESPAMVLTWMCGMLLAVVTVVVSSEVRG